MLMEQSARLEVKWYVNMLIDLISHNAPGLINSSAFDNSLTAKEITERTLDRMTSGISSMQEHEGLHRLLRYNPELSCTTAPWKIGYTYSSNLRMSDIRTVMVDDLAAHVAGLPLTLSSTHTNAGWKDLIADSLRYRTRSLKAPMYIIYKREALVSDIVAVCARYGVKKAAITSSDVQPAGNAHGRGYFSKDLVRATWHQDALDTLTGGDSLRAFMHFLANPSDYSMGGLARIAGEQKLIATYTKRSELSVEEEAASYAAVLKAMPRKSSPLHDTVVKGRARSCGVRANVYESMLEYGVDKIREVLADIEDLHQTLPALALVPAIDRVKDPDSLYGSSAYEGSVTESVGLMLAIAADPSLASLLVDNSEKDSKGNFKETHPIVGQFLRMAMTEGSPKALAVAYEVARLEGMIGGCVDLSTLVGHECDPKAVGMVVKDILAEVPADGEGD